MSVLVTDGEQRSTLALVRSLGRAGVAVRVAEALRPSLAGSSRYCAEQFVYPSPIDAPAEFQSWLVSQAGTGKYQMVLPMTDITTRLVAEIRPALEQHVVLPVACPGSLALLQDKRETLLAARRVGVGGPATYMLDPKEKIESVAAKLRYPVVLKPRVSRYLQDGRWFTGTVQYADSPEDLITKYHKAHAAIPYPLVQERIEGPGIGVFLLVWHGELKAAFAHRRLREKPPSGGVSVLRESVPLDHAVVSQSLALLKTVGWNGVAMVEYKLDRRDGQAKLMEVNGRFWGSLQLAIDAGMDFPLLLYRLARGEDIPPQLDYQVGVKTRWLLGDLDHLLAVLRNRGGIDGVAGRSKLAACWDFLKFYQRDTHFEVLKFQDPAPGLLELRMYLRDLLGWADPRVGVSIAH